LDQAVSEGLVPFREHLESEADTLIAQAMDLGECYDKVCRDFFNDLGLTLKAGTLNTVLRFGRHNDALDRYLTNVAGQSLS
jgi:hypothetical protein